MVPGTQHIIDWDLKRSAVASQIVSCVESKCQGLVAIHALTESKRAIASLPQGTLCRLRTSHQIILCSRIPVCKVPKVNTARSHCLFAPHARGSVQCSPKTRWISTVQFDRRGCTQTAWDCYWHCFLEPNQSSCNSDQSVDIIFKVGPGLPLSRGGVS